MQKNGIQKETILNQAVAIGKFDGLHRGHQKLMQALVEKQKAGFSPMLLTIDLGVQKEILQEREFQQMCQSFGVTQVKKLTFDDTLRQMSPETFVKEVLVEQIHAGYVVVGDDFCFGFERAGNAEMLRQLGRQYGIEVQIVEQEMQDGEPVSSSRIREELTRGDMVRVSELLGFPYYVEGEVGHGNEVGRQLGFPTINLTVDATKFLPRAGVYASLVRCEGAIYRGITNVGSNPTVNAQADAPVVETHLMEYQGDLYGKEVQVFLLMFQRPEQKFEDLDCLKSQIEKDVEMADAFFQEFPTEGIL